MRLSMHRWVLVAALIVTAMVYWPGLSGGFLFDDYPNIVDNHGVQPSNASFSSLVGAALSSPSSEFKRPLASLSFAANYLISGLNPYWMKLSNLVIHLLNGLLVFWLSRALMRFTFKRSRAPVGARSRAMPFDAPEPAPFKSVTRERATSAGTDGESTSAIEDGKQRTGIIAALIAASWMLLPINLTGVLYVVQRMESMANLFVLVGLIGYVAGRCRMLGLTTASGAARGMPSRGDRLGFILCAISITLPTALGILAKETAVMLPLYAFLIEWILFAFQRTHDASAGEMLLSPLRRDRRMMALFGLVLALPMVLGLAWLLPHLLNPETWATRDFSMSTRLFSEARIVVDYIVWTLLPTPHALSFYHDNFHISSGLLTPWTTLASILVLVALIASVIGLRRRQPLMALGIALFLGCQLLTGTIIPLELIYEHRNYFASFGLMLAVVPFLAAPRAQTFALPRYALLAGLMVCWTALTALTAYAWGNPLRLDTDLASRAPLSSRAQYGLGRTYIILSHYDPASPFTKLVYAPLERAAAIPDASILPEQALIFFNSRMHLPLEDDWWDSMIDKLTRRKPGVQDESSLGALTKCMREGKCNLPKGRMTAAYLAALSHPDPSARLLAMYGDYAWNLLDDHALGLRMTEAAVKTSPDEQAYQITLVRMYAAEGKTTQANAALKQLQRLNIGGRLDGSLKELHHLPGMAR